MRFEHEKKACKTIDIVDWDYTIYIKFSVDFLLNYSVSLVLEDLIIPIGNIQIEIYNIDNFSLKLKMYGYIFAF